MVGPFSTTSRSASIRTWCASARAWRASACSAPSGWRRSGPPGGCDLEPEVAYANALVSGLNTTANWRWKEGWLRQARRELQASGERLAIFAAHHPLGRILAGRLDPERRVILLHGHHHRATARIQDRVLEVGAGSAFSPRIRDAHNGFNLLRFDDAGVTVEPHALHADGHRHLGSARFEMRGGHWQHL